MSPPLSVDQVEHYVGETKGFPAIEIVFIVKKSVPVFFEKVHMSATKLETNRAMQYGNHNAALEYMDLVWRKLHECRRQNRVLGLNTESA